MHTKKDMQKTLRIGLMLYAVLMTIGGTAVLGIIIGLVPSEQLKHAINLMLAMGGLFYGTAIIALIIRAKFTKKQQEVGGNDHE
ncbi:hypothetical protein P5663_00890 [Priestia flexa]|uniref:Uncharacterized protein n=1 Tax=Priestia veravalensis TaxID=1414648 RepID=A0A0V8JJG1_9BACI|nr:MULTISPECIES: hypothetical protein [Priestia]AQX56230.1 hypothetical protein BC359_19330 [Priestia flexa]KSU87191.1 hypothetical protein AS180_14585 [Priestia veravalensis]MCG7314202.1 hypothetical protein [Priestia flexa]MEC0667638.1 hypothetical protein [Priestia flexa]WEZ08543.1 hypothetical protein P5663_00890 [Priestia flexa]